ncbi:hypothetical protein EYZ11_000850 [Aspergillus tanneri]|uniref:Uncharacterized protein n=1 Tax=Aspergillus tanneri TaxID=1220188 RepID=A0A4S3JW44_9EURO|nr:hypothetical protein EYZ11_000850 [Aspergillus tanneri]
MVGSQTDHRTYRGTGTGKVWVAVEIPSLSQDPGIAILRRTLQWCQYWPHLVARKKRHDPTILTGILVFIDQLYELDGWLTVGGLKPSDLSKTNLKQKKLVLG